MAGNIINLMYRDYYAFWNHKIFRTSILFFPYVLTGPLFKIYDFTLLWMATLIFGLIRFSVINVFIFEMKSGTEKFFASLPVRRMDLVLTRYFEVIVITVLILILGYFSNTISRVFGRPDLQLPVAYYATVSIIFSLVASFSLPFYFKYDAIKGSIISLFFGIIVLSQGVLYGLTKMPPRKIIESFLLNEDLSTALAITGITILLFIVSIIISIVVYSKKDI